MSPMQGSRPAHMGVVYDPHAPGCPLLIFLSVSMFDFRPAVERDTSFANSMRGVKRTSEKESE